MTHYCVSVEKDNDGWWVAECNCGWTTDAIPALDDVVDAFAEHRIAHELA